MSLFTIWESKSLHPATCSSTHQWAVEKLVARRSAPEWRSQCLHSPTGLIHGSVLSLPWDRRVMVMGWFMFGADGDEVTGFHTGFVNLFNSSEEVSLSPPVISTSSVSLISWRSWVITGQLKTAPVWRSGWFCGVGACHSFMGSVCSHPCVCVCVCTYACGFTLCPTVCASSHVLPVTHSGACGLVASYFWCLLSDLHHS